MKRPCPSRGLHGVDEGVQEQLQLFEVAGDLNGAQHAQDAHEAEYDEDAARLDVHRLDAKEPKAGSPAAFFLCCFVARVPENPLTPPLPP